jgi:hypothetical protein
MKRKRLRIASVVVLLGLVAAIPASTQVLFGSGGDTAQESDLPLLILVNRMELTVDQMEEIHGLLGGLLEDREALDLRRDELEAEMIAFHGSAEELDEILEAFRSETQERVEAARGHAQDVIDRIKEVLTLKQGEILGEFVRGLLDERGASALPQRGVGRILGQRGSQAGEPQITFGQWAERAALDLREQMLGQLEERFADNPEILRRLQQRLGGAAPNGGSRDGMQRGPFGQGFQQRFGGEDERMPAQRGVMGHRGLDWIERLVEVLELKLEAIE